MAGPTTDATDGGDRATLERALELVSNAVSGTGVLLNVYRRAGAVKTGSFQTQDPSPAEIARQERMKREA